MRESEDASFATGTSKTIQGFPHGDELEMSCWGSVLHLRSIRGEFVASAAFQVPQDFLSGYNAAVSNLRQFLWDSVPH